MIVERAAITYRRLRDPSPSERRELAGVMACDGEEDRFEEFVEWLEKEFRDLDHRSRMYIVAELEAQMVGFVRLWRSPHIDEWVIDGIVVSPSHRNVGIGHSLLLRALDQAASLCADSVVAHIRKGKAPAIRIHEKAGFRRETETYRNSYGEECRDYGWQYRIALPAKDGQP